MAKQYGSRFMCYNSWLRTEQVLYIKKLMTTTTSTEWVKASSSYTEVDVWGDAAKLGRARKGYASIHGVSHSGDEGDDREHRDQNIRLFVDLGDEDDCPSHDSSPTGVGGC